MFTIEQIHLALSKVKSGSDFPEYIKNLKQLGVSRYINYVSNGMTEYYGSGDFAISAEEKYPEIQVNPVSSAQQLKTALLIHQQGQTDYMTFCRQAAEAGVEKWISNLEEMNVSYYDKNGRILIIESIPEN